MPNYRISARSYRSIKDDIEAESIECRNIKAPKYVYDQICREAKRLGTSNMDMATILWEFYSMEHFDLFIRRIRERYMQGLTALEIAHLSVLFTMLQDINDQTGMLD